MSFGNYSTNPNLNTTIAGENVGEGCPPGNINNAIRQLMADGKSLFDTVGNIDLSGYAPLDAPVFTGQPTYAGRGGFLHNNNPANASGRVFVQAEGTPAPTMANGDWLATF